METRDIIIIILRPTDPAWKVFWPEQHKIKLIWPNYIAQKLSRDIQCKIYISLEVHVNVNIVANNAIANNWTRRTNGYNGTRRAIGTKSTQRGKTRIQHAIGNAWHGKNRTQLMTGQTALEDSNAK